MARQGKKVSAFVRESIEEKLIQLERQDFENRMKTAYQDLAEENINISEDFKFSDAENLPEATPWQLLTLKSQKHSIVNLSQIRTIDNRRLIGPKIAVISNEIMGKVDTALKNSLALK